MECTGGGSVGDGPTPASGGRGAGSAQALRAVMATTEGEQREYTCCRVSSPLSGAGEKLTLAFPPTGARGMVLPVGVWEAV